MKTTKSHEMRRLRSRCLLLGAVLWSVAACEAADRQAGTTAGDTALAAPRGADSGASVPPDAAREGPPMEPPPVNDVRVTVTEYDIEMPRSLPPGRTRFEVTNQGGMDHMLELRMGDTEAVLDPPAAPGETRSLTVDLTPGTWEVYCPIGNHAELGMRRELTVP